VEDGVLERPDPQLSTPRTTAPRVFISYRRADCQPQANGLYDGLSHRLPEASIFMDLDSIPPGADFEQHIRQEIQICDLVLAARFCPMPFDEAQAIDVVRQRCGRFLGIDDVAAQTSLSEPTMARLRETAVFL
jgi:TIR domain-containing protein